MDVRIKCDFQSLYEFLWLELCVRSLLLHVLSPLSVGLVDEVLLAVSTNATCAASTNATASTNAAVPPVLMLLTASTNVVCWRY